MLLPTLPAALALTCLAQNQGATTPPDAAAPSALETTLKDAKLTYTDVGNFYRLRYNFTDTKRSQAGFIRKEIYTYNGLKVHELFSLCYDKPEPPSTELLQSVFLKRFSIGGLVLEAPTEKQPNWRIRFHVDTPTTISPERLKTYLLLALSTADSLEKELSPSQEDKL